MHDTHPPLAELQWYVTDGLACAMRGWPSDRMTSLERHVSQCDGCADTLTRAAQAELVFEALAAEPASTASRGAIGPWIGAALAVAALIFLVIAGARSGGGPAAAESGAATTTTVDAGPWISADGDVAADTDRPD